MNDLDFDNPYIQKQFRNLLKKIIQEENASLKYNKKSQGVIYGNPTDVRTADVVLNSISGSTPEESQIIRNVAVRPGLHLKNGNEVYIEKINGSASNIFIDANKYTQQIDLITSFKSINTNATLNVHDNVVYITASENMTVTLPLSAKCAGSIFVLVRLDNTASVVTITGQSGQVINGYANITIGNFTSTSSRKWIQADGSNFWVISSN